MFPECSSANWLRRRGKRNSQRVTTSAEIAQCLFEDFMGEDFNASFSDDTTALRKTRLGALWVPHLISVAGIPDYIGLAPFHNVNGHKRTVCIALRFFPPSPIESAAVDQLASMYELSAP